MLKSKDIRELNRDAKEHSRKSVKDFDPAGILRECECYDDVLKMVKKGRFTRDIVDFIHGQGELTHVSRRALTYKVQKFKDEILTPIGEIVEERIAAGDDNFDEEDVAAVGHVLRKLFHRQAKRVNMETDTEMSLNKLFSGTHREYLTAMGMGERLIKILKQLDMFDVSGVENTGQMASKIDGVMAKPESRHKILGILNLIMDRPDMFKNVSSLDAARTKKEKKKRPKRNNKYCQLTDGKEDRGKAQ